MEGKKEAPITSAGDNESVKHRSLATNESKNCGAKDAPTTRVDGPIGTKEVTVVVPLKMEH